MVNQIDMPAAKTLQTPWRSLLNNAEKNAAIISAEVINDAVLGKAVAAVVSTYFAQIDRANCLREEYAAADIACRDTRAKAADAMAALGLTHDWDQDDLQAADIGLWAALQGAMANASATNQRRAEASKIERESLDNAIDEIDMCAGITTLRHLREFRCAGDAFCAAYIAALLVADCMIGNTLKARGMKILSDFLQYSVGLKVAYRECDIYVHNKTAASLGRAMGIDNTNGLGAALILAIKKNSTTSSEIRSQLQDDGEDADKPD